MNKTVFTVDEDTPIEEAARIMADNKIGGLPVLRKGRVVGIITETDLFKIFLELMGAREMGVRVTALIADKPGQLAKVTQAISSLGGNFIAFGQFTGEDPSNRMITFKVTGLKAKDVKSAIQPLVESLIDIRE
ncbi:MAG: CBS domain-containing protein, partial [Anaerolineales bacterium]|nr:CBS domain-containing protein [Anaerolineales bacterium]